MLAAAIFAVLAWLGAAAAAAAAWASAKASRRELNEHLEYDHNRPGS